MQVHRALEGGWGWEGPWRHGALSQALLGLWQKAGFTVKELGQRSEHLRGGAVMLLDPGSHPVLGSCPDFLRLGPSGCLQEDPA